MRPPRPSVSGLVAAVDEAVAPQLFERTLASVRRVGERASYGKAFWFSFGEPCCWPEALAMALAPRMPDRARLLGVEWWLGRMPTTDVPLEFHHDRDLKLFERSGRLSHPLWSSVFFLNRVRGGSLFVTDQRLVHRGTDYRLVPQTAREFASVRPAPNRFVRFPGRLLHGVLDANDRVPSGRLPGPEARPRLSIVLNWWTRRPLAVRRWSPALAYPELALER